MTKRATAARTTLHSFSNRKAGSATIAAQATRIARSSMPFLQHPLIYQICASVNSGAQHCHLSCRRLPCAAARCHQPRNLLEINIDVSNLYEEELFITWSTIKSATPEAIVCLACDAPQFLGSNPFFLRFPVEVCVFDYYQRNLDHILGLATMCNRLRRLTLTPNYPVAEFLLELALTFAGQTIRELILNVDQRTQGQLSVA